MWSWTDCQVKVQWKRNDATQWNTAQHSNTLLSDTSKRPLAITWLPGLPGPIESPTHTHVTRTGVTPHTYTITTATPLPLSSPPLSPPFHLDTFLLYHYHHHNSSSHLALHLHQAPHSRADDLDPPDYARLVLGNFWHVNNIRVILQINPRLHHYHHHTSLQSIYSPPTPHDSPFHLALLHHHHHQSTVQHQY